MRRPTTKLLPQEPACESPQTPFKKRRHPRQPFSGEATIYWMGPDLNPRSSVAGLVDASEGGMAITIPEPIAVDTEIWILLDDGTDGRGQVRYCNPAEKGFLAGLKFIAEAIEPLLDGTPHGCLLEWIDKSGRLASCPAAIRNGHRGEIELVIPQIVPCPAIMMLTASQVRCFCCTRDWWPEGESYCFRVDPLGETHARSLA